MSDQMESRHFFAQGDVIENGVGRKALVTESYALYARIRWQDGEEQEIDQFDPECVVLERGAGVLT